MPAIAAEKLPPIVVIFGDEEFAKSRTLQNSLDEFLPPDVDRGMALVHYDASRPEDQGGPSLAAVMDDLHTLPFFADRRLVVVRDADKFITAHREKLENYVQNPAPRACLILETRSFPKTTRLYKAANAAGGRFHEQKQLRGRELAAFVDDAARAAHKKLAPGVAQRLIDLVGPDQGLLANEIEKLALYTADQPLITHDHLRDLVGQSREEKIFAVMDAAAVANLPRALQLWRQTLTTDPAAAFKAPAGIAFVLRKWLTAHQLAAARTPIRQIAPKVMMWGREKELATLLERLPTSRIHRLLATVADLDAQAKTGRRSIETGVEALLIDIADQQPA